MADNSNPFKCSIENERITLFSLSKMKNLYERVSRLRKKKLSIKCLGINSLSFPCIVFHKPSSNLKLGHQETPKSRFVLREKSLNRKLKLKPINGVMKTPPETKANVYNVLNFSIWMSCPILLMNCQYPHLKGYHLVGNVLCCLKDNV